MTESHKLLLPLGGRPIVRWAVEAALAAGLVDVAVVVGESTHTTEIEAALDGVQVHVLRNEHASSGIATSVECAVKWATGRAAGLLLLLGDEPFVSPGLIARAVREWTKRPVPALRVRYADRPGHPVIVRLPFEGPSVSGDRGLASALDHAVEIEVSETAPLDVDTQADYREVLARLPR